jgi:hypothetical protein
VNDVHDDLEVWVEAWADLYVLPRGAKVAFSYDVAGDTDVLESEIADGRLTFWFGGRDAPVVMIDGAEAEPIDQDERRSRTRQGRP